jgi:hypothetical protein
MQKLFVQFVKTFLRRQKALISIILLGLFQKKSQIFILSSFKLRSTICSFQEGQENEGCTF